MRTTLLAYGRRAALTLIELVVVLVILAALAAMVVPRLSGVSAQGSSAANASIVDEVNRAVQLFENLPGSGNKQPQGWDSLMNSSGAMFSKLHPNLTGTSDVTKPGLQIATLTDTQVASLNTAGIFGFHDADESRAALPSDNSTVWHSISSGAKAVTLIKTPITSGHGSTFIDMAFAIDQYKNNWNNEFVVCGLGGGTSLKGATMTELPLIQSANPAQYYSRVLAVFMVPSSTTTTVFRAQYVGCFLPDGTSQRSNVTNFNSANVTTN